MNCQSSTLSEDRQLTEDERTFIMWLLANGDERSRSLLPQVDKARVTSRCACGCASIDLSIDGITYRERLRDFGMETLSEYQWRTDRGALCAVTLFAINGLVATLDLWSVDGQETARQLPSVSKLEPMNDRA